MKFLKIVALTIALLQCVLDKGSSDGLGGIRGLGDLGGYGRSVGGSGGLGGSYGGVPGSSYGGSLGGGGGFGGIGGGLSGGYAGWGSEEIAPDGQGGSSFRTEQGDGSGKVKGSYGYRDAQGFYRMVEYSVGPAVFSATVNTNEPGVNGMENPADVIMNVEQTPAGIQERYRRPAGSEFSGRGGWTAGRIGGGIGGSGGFGGMSYGGISSGGYGGISSGGYGGMGGTNVGSYGGVGGISSGGYGEMGGIISSGFPASP